MNQSFAIRSARIEDADTICRFLLAMASESEHRALDPATVRRGLARVLLDPARSPYRVAVRDGRIVGQLMLTREWSDWQAGWYWWIQSVYVAPEFRGEGVFQALYRHVLEEARASGEVCGLRLYVERDNARAMRAYERLGMTLTPYVMYEVSDLADADTP